jgi:hypothetical protein
VGYQTVEISEDAGVCGEDGVKRILDYSNVYAIQLIVPFDCGMQMNNIIILIDVVGHETDNDVNEDHVHYREHSPAVDRRYYYHRCEQYPTTSE